MSESRVASILRRFKAGESIDDLYRGAENLRIYYEDVIRAYMLGVDVGTKKDEDDGA